MASRFAPAALFEHRPPPRRYRTLRDELAAVHARRKPLLLEVWPRDSILAGEDGYPALARAALGLGLTVVQQPGPHDQVNVFVLHPDQIWRVPAYGALSRMYGAWSDGAEATASHLLGYRDDEIAAWLADCRWRRAGWTGETIYLLLSASQRARLVRLGGRSLDPDTAEGATVLWHARGGVVRRDALRRLPEGTTLARAAIDHAAFGRLFRGAPRRGQVAALALTPARTRALNSALASPIERLGVRGWR